MDRLSNNIFNKWLLWLALAVACLIPALSLAQDRDDSILFQSESLPVTAGDTGYNDDKTNYSSEAVFRSVPDTTVERLKREKSFAYANDPAYWVKEKFTYKKGFWDYFFDFFASDIVRVMFYVLLGGLVLFVLYRIIVLNDLFVFYSSKKNARSFQDTASPEIDRESIDRLLDEAILQKNYNLATRYLYLKTLYSLNDKQWIQFHPEGTDNEYLEQMSKHRQSRQFRFLTRVYEYAWYGKFNITDEQFATVQNHFKNFHAGIS